MEQIYINGRFNRKEYEKVVIKEIMEFITYNFNDYTFERFCEQTNQDKFLTLESFLEHNEKCLKNLDKEDLNFIYELVNKIEHKNILMVDEENMEIEWEAHCIYFNIDNKLVIMHPR